MKHEAVGDKNEALEMLEQSLIEEATRREDDSLVGTGQPRCLVTLSTLHLTHG